MKNIICKIIAFLIFKLFDFLKNYLDKIEKKHTLIFVKDTTNKKVIMYAESNNYNEILQFIEGLPK